MSRKRFVKFELTAKSISRQILPQHRRIQSTTDRREYFLRPTQKYIDYYSISYSYLHTVIERVRKRFPAEDCDKMEQMLSVISTELMPELDMLAKCRHPEAPKSEE